MPRLFVALDVPEEAAADLERLCVGLPDVRWAQPEQLHLTLRFIGEVDHATFYDIGEALAAITMAPFELVLKGLGQFPPRGMPHTLWVGVEENEELSRLKRRVERCLGEVGLPPEKRKFVPHVTIARFRAEPPEARLASYLARRNLFRTEPFPVSHFNLYSSHLRPQGAEYLLEASYDFVTGVMERV